MILTQRDDGKRRGSRNGRKAKSRQFADFIDESKLVDVPVSGNSFSWFSGDGKSMSRINRFFIEDYLIDRWRIEGQRIGPKSISDH